MIARNPTILVVDSDLGFVFWLGQAFERAGFSAFPAKNAICATELIREHRLSVDILVIDPLIEHAARFIFGLRQRGADLKIVAALGSLSETLPSIPKFDCIKRKSPQFTNVIADEWIDLIRALCSGMSPAQNLLTVRKI